MRYLKYFGLLGLFVILAGTAANAQVRVGVGIGVGPGYVPLRLTSVRLPTAATATTDITHTLARLTAITVPNTSMAAFLSEWVHGSTVSTAATGPAIVISAATMTTVP